MRDWLYVVDHARAIDMIFHKGKIAETYNIGGFNEWEPSLQFEVGIEETVKWYLDNQEWMDHVTSGEYQKYYENMYKDRLCLFPKIIPSFFTIKEGSTSHLGLLQ